MSSNFFHISYR